MALQDYAELDEEDYYGQPFSRNGVVSIWLGMTTDEDDPEGLDVLQDLCGVGYYDGDKQDMNCHNFRLMSVRLLLRGLSYRDSFSEEVCSKASEMGIEQARWIVAQYDFNYDPSKVKRKVENDPIFIGVFYYEMD